MIFRRAIQSVGCGADTQMEADGDERERRQKKEMKPKKKGAEIQTEGIDR